MEKSESRIQQTIYNEFNNQYCLKFHSPRYLIYSVANGGKRDAREAKGLKLTGTVAGISDLQIQIEGGKVINVEVKTETGKQSPAQKEIQQRIEDLGGVYLVVRSLEDFKTQIKKYL